MGPCRAGALAHASDDALRTQAASGGAVTAILVAALEHGEIDAALVCRTEVSENRVRPEFVLAATREELIGAQGSKYVAVNFVRDALPLLREFEGRVAVVGLPCDLSTLKRYRASSAARIRAEVAFTVGLFCGHNSTTDLVDMVTDRIEARSGSAIEDFAFRVGHWRGRMQYRLQDGQRVDAPARDLLTYRHLGLFAERKCLSCSDHFGYDADISAGDVWLYRLRSEAVKRTGLLIRSAEGERALEVAESSGILTVERVDPVIMLDGQARIAPHHHDVPARRWAGRYLGVRIASDPGPNARRPRVLARIDALITVAAFRVTDTARGRRLVARVPLVCIRLLSALKKALMVVAR
jgi:coenzyme F420-reducing hydrogenase beta subunit